MLGNTAHREDHISETTLLQVNATLIVGLLFFFSLSTTLFDYGNNSTSPIQAQVLVATAAIIPFALSSGAILFLHLASVMPASHVHDPDNVKTVTAIKIIAAGGAFVGIGQVIITLSIILYNVYIR